MFESLYCGEKSVWLIQDLRIIYVLYRHVLTPVNNAQLILKLEILDKLRLVTFNKWQHKQSVTLELVHTSSRETQILVTLTHKTLKMLVAKLVPFLR